MRFFFLAIFFSSFVVGVPTYANVVAYRYAPVTVGNFSPSERRKLLAQEKVDATPLGFYDQDKSEKELIEVALQELRDVNKTRGPALGYRCLAMLWEEMTAQIDQRLGYASYSVSRGYVWRRGGQEFYVYQGPIAFGPRRLHYTLVFSPDGRIRNAPAERVDRIEAWKPDLISMEQL